MKLVEHEEITGYVRTMSGLRIGGSKDNAGIGETDNPIIRHPITNVPYIPGSSWKGKLRCILEQKYDKYNKDQDKDGKNGKHYGKPCPCGKDDCFVCTLFGCGTVGGNTKPTRLIFRDSYLVKDSEDSLGKLPGHSYLKAQTAIDRSKGSAQKGSLNSQELIPEGIILTVRFTIRWFDTDIPKKAEYYGKLAETYGIIEKDGIGGGVSRGLGQIKVFQGDWLGEDKEHKSMALYLSERANASKVK
ncbi:MAG: type III-A CRISPR-associated RAMP protein Csm3 [Planctomycetes bacterium]|nr:type III-A CRISPR-associated RAMP protein Csm3 [Planctomycetota bacterium]